MDSQDEVTKEIQKSFGDGALRYVLNKKRGGDSGKKGSRYEDYFLAFKTAEIAARLIGNTAEWPKITGQRLGFVDDVAIKATVATEFFQLKNVASISWTSGEHPLEDDFRNQYILSTQLREPNPTTHLVVSSEELKKKLAASMPSTIGAYSSVITFPYCDGSLNRLVLEHPKLHDVLKKLSKNPNPSLDEIEGVYGVLIAAHLWHPDGAEVDVLLRSANNKIPNMLCSIDFVAYENHVRDDFVRTLAAIPGLTYAFDKGFFSWTGFGTSGIFSTDCASEEFAQFQAEIINQQPMTFDDFEGLLP